jgi:fructose-bisphosphate aldolase, class II
MLVATAELVGAAHAGASGVGAFNVITIEHAEGIVAGAEQAGLPVILQISQNAVGFHGGRLAPIAAATHALAATAAVPVALHLDHVERLDLVEQAAAHGFGSVMFDAATLDYAANVAAVRQAAQRCHQDRLWLEGELGEVGGKNGAHVAGARTDPDEARDYVAATGVDALAVAVGSSHAMVERTATLDHALIRSLRAAVPVPLVLHGSSGVPDEDLAEAVRAGISKVNIGTALNVAFTGAIRGYLASHSGVDPRRYLAPARTAVADTVGRYLRLLALV